MSRIAPLGIMIMIHYYAFPTDFRDGDHTAPAVSELMGRLLRSDMLRLAEYIDNSPEAREGMPIYEITAKGRAWVSALCNVPFPVCRWEVPNDDDAA